MSEDNKGKTNGLGTDPLQRLASFKPPRDLSLGGVKPNKKLFTPNLNVSRNKNKGPSTTNNKEKRKEEKNRRDRKNDKNKNFNKNGPNVIKSSGVFSEGLGSSERHSSRVSYGRNTETASVLHKPTIRVKDVVKIDKELEEQKIRSVFGDAGPDEEDGVDFKQIRDRDTPVKLPMYHGDILKKKSVSVKQEVIVKTEPSEFDYGVPHVLAEVKKAHCENTEVVNILKKTEPTLILLQLPDSLPGRGGSKDEDLPRRRDKNTSDQPSTSTGEPAEEKQVEDNRCRLSDLEEGKIGKLRVHRSGRVSLLLGDTVFEVSMGTQPSFHQEVVSVAHDESSRSANMVSLGTLQHKLNLVPDWEAMFQDMVV